MCHLFVDYRHPYEKEVTSCAGIQYCPLFIILNFVQVNDVWDAVRFNLA